ncbi:LUD domain-containing protein [Haloarchaeobius sp. HME9146]|uniref:LutC/YkgG family protein n=1 Tax=Haloarchaeobius sp. HME9146 TaxID=2978732 RepID=UPI0021BFCE63|nr:LUD domain-containing protein [Haloarchaeobius sp. HME9146]MCT9094826.1 LUD domain-containing protein [Haloarchaeobius sp. HME9146]
MTGVESDVAEQWAARAGDFGVEVTWTTADEATAAIADLVDDPAVGAPLPWDDVSLPEGVQTDPTPAALDAAKTGVTAADLAVAEYGSLVLRQTPEGSEPASVFPDLHVAVLRADDVVPDMAAAFEWLGDELRETRDSAILATGPSATADMGALVKGAHGPKAVHVVVIR